MTIRKVLLSTLGHVDHGKTSLLDKIRRTAVTSGEAGGITQAIGVSIIPMQTIEKICGKLLDPIKKSLTLPGIVAIDTPGHAAFTSLRKRGGSLADIAILVVDINEGFKPQTIESIEILKSQKVPFIVAANKVDLIPGMKNDTGKNLVQNINSLDYNVTATFETKLYELVGKFNELGLNADRFDRVTDYTKQLAIIPVSAHTGQGIPELLMVLSGLAQKFLESKLHIEEQGPAQGTVLEVKEVKGFGMTIDAILYNGQLNVNDTLIIGDIDGAFEVRVRALLEPSKMGDLRDKKSKFDSLKKVTAATGVKIVAPGLDKAKSGMPIRSLGNKESLDEIKLQVNKGLTDVFEVDSEELGVIIKADTIGGLEALKVLLEEKNIPISHASLGNVSRKDMSILESLENKDPEYAAVLGFNINYNEGLENQDNVFIGDVIYRVIEDYLNYVEKLKRKIELEELNKITRPCKFAVLKGYVFRQSNPAIVGAEIEIGKIKVGDPIMAMDGRRISSVKSMREGQDNVNVALQGKQIAMAMEGVTVGRQVNEGDFLYSDIDEKTYHKLRELKKHLTDVEINVLKEIASIKRKNNPVWGVS